MCAEFRTASLSEFFLGKTEELSKRSREVRDTHLKKGKTEEMAVAKGKICINE